MGVPAVMCTWYHWERIWKQNKSIHSFHEKFHLFKDFKAGRWEMPKKSTNPGEAEKEQVGMDHL